ncbi:hypothetical protein STRIP9103_08966 [Streptomyces ipomoeae 91-03]|uniref:Uncharacterized protein n=1 Tax=Streptomyces ipomoeae 91-03 TaxID=698759 RepID=L1KVV6_9ACTN|nr:hypothetical protein STRIP9103_08966 [Streptomyces ipomoeae 91-03]
MNFTSRTNPNVFEHDATHPDCLEMSCTVVTPYPEEAAPWP